MKKRAAIFVSLVLVAALGIYMIAFAEGDALSLYAKTKTLLFDTTNVSLSAEATFKYDGELFKTLHGEYKQDDINSYLRIMLDTPKVDGTVYTGGYTVVGNGETVYSNDTKDGNYYVVSPGAVEKTLLQNNATLSSSLDLVEAGLRAISTQLDKYVVKQTAADGSSTYAVKADGMPEFINAAATFFAQRYIDREYGYLYYYGGDQYCRSEIEDYNALFCIVYERLYGEKIPEYYFEDTDKYTDEDWSRHSAVSDKMYSDLSNEALKHSGGVVVALADGSYGWYKNNADYMRAVNFDFVYYDNYSQTFCGFYEKKFGTPLTEDDMFAISNSANEELWEVYYELSNEVDEYYREQAAINPDTVAIIVHADGSYDEFNKDPYDIYDNERTTTQEIIANFARLELANVDVTVTEDADGHIAGVKGAVELAITDKDGVRHSLEIGLDMSIFDYGTTEVAEFNAADYGLVTFDEYMTALGLEPEYDPYEGDSYMERLKKIPETIEFAGKTYETQVYVYELNED